jgi:hypothetical protein
MWRCIQWGRVELGRSLSGLVLTRVQLDIVTRDPPYDSVYSRAGGGRSREEDYMASTHSATDGHRHQGSAM